MPKGTSPKAGRRPIARRQQLLDAAAWTFARKGYRAANIGDIIERAGVARGTFYLYFDSKDQVFLAIVEDFRDRIQRMLEEPEAPVRLAEHHGQAMLQRSFRRWLELFAAHRDAAAVILREATSIDSRFEGEAARLRGLALELLRGALQAVSDPRPRESAGVARARRASPDGDGRGTGERLRFARHLDRSRRSRSAARRVRVERHPAG